MPYHPEGYATFKFSACQELADILWHYFKECGVMTNSDNIAEIYQSIAGIDQMITTLQVSIDGLNDEVAKIKSALTHQKQSSLPEARDQVITPRESRRIRSIAFYKEFGLNLLCPEVVGHQSALDTVMQSRYQQMLGAQVINPNFSVADLRRAIIEDFADNHKPTCPLCNGVSNASEEDSDQ